MYRLYTPFLGLQQDIYRMWFYINILFRFHSVFIERFSRSTDHFMVPVLCTASKQLQNIMISWAMEWSDVGETMLVFVSSSTLFTELSENVAFFCFSVERQESTFSYHLKNGRSVRSIEKKRLHYKVTYCITAITVQHTHSGFFDHVESLG